MLIYGGSMLNGLGMRLLRDNNLLCYGWWTLYIKGTYPRLIGIRSLTSCTIWGKGPEYHWLLWQVSTIDFETWSPSWESESWYYAIQGRVEHRYLNLNEAS